MCPCGHGDDDGTDRNQHSRDRLQHGRDPPSAVRHLVPVGRGAFTWLVVLLVVGVVLSLDSLSVLSVVVLAALGLLFLPIYRFRPWQPGVTDRLVDFVARRRRTLAAAVGLFVLVRLPVVSDLLGPVLGLLLLPLRAVPQILFSVTVFYGERVGDPAGKLLFDAGRLYVEFRWLYTVGVAVAWLVPERNGEGGA